MRKLILVSFIMISFLQAEFVRNDNLNVVLDTSTGLIWEDNLNTKDNIYTWQEAKNYCDNLTLGETNDWYLPSRNEYQSIMTAFYGEVVDDYDALYYWYSNNKYLKNGDYFAIKEFENVNQSYWTNEVYIDSTLALRNSDDKAWAIHFYYGFNAWEYTTYALNVRCVRNTNGNFNSLTFASLTTLQTNSTVSQTENFIRNDNLDVVWDTENNLLWQDNSDAKIITKNWQDAINYCETLNFAGINDWHLPTAKELTTIVDSSNYPTIVDGFINIQNSYYWSSSYYKDNDLYAFDIYFYDGNYYQSKKSLNDYVRCVKSDNNNFNTSTFASLITLQENNSNTPPILTISTSQSTINEGDSINFIANANDSDGYIDSYYWNFGDGTTSNNANPIHIYTQTGTYLVSCSVTDDKGETTVKILSIIVVENQKELIRNDKFNVVYDSETNLLWQDDLNVKNNLYTWEEAKEYCKNLTLAGIDNWYLPIADELFFIRDNNGHIINGFNNTKDYYFWSHDSSYASESNTAVSIIGFGEESNNILNTDITLIYSGSNNIYLGNLTLDKNNNNPKLSVRCVSKITPSEFENLNYSNLIPTLELKINNDEVKVGEKVNIFSIVNDDGELSYKWEIDNKTFTTKDLQYTFSQKGTYKVKLTVTDEFGESVNDSIFITVINSTPIVTSQNKSVNSGETLTFTSNDFLAGFSDSDGDSLIKIKITKLPTIGNLKLNGVNVYLNQEISASELNSLTFSANVEETTVISFSGKAYDGNSWSDEANMYLITIKGEPIAPLTVSKKVIYFNKNMLEKYMKIEAVGGEEPYSWIAKYGDFKYLNSDKSIVVYKPHSSLTFDDTITLTDKSGESIKIDAKYIKELEVTPSIRYIFRGSKTTFTIIGGIAPFEATVIDGDAEIVSKIDNKVTIKASNLTSIFHVKFSDSSGQEVIKEINVVDELKLSPQIAYFNDFSGNLEIKISGGVAPYSATASAGDVSVDGDIAIYEPENRYSEQNVTIKDSLGQEASMKILVENVNALTISPSNPSVDIGSLTPFKAKLGTGNYDWSVEKGELDTYSGESVIYTAPEYDTIDKLTVTDSSGAKFSATILVGNAKANNKTLNLKKGWNLISIPIDISLYKLSEDSIPPIGSMNMSIFNSYEVIWKYLNEWIKNPEVINQSEGFWIKQIKDDIVEFEGDEYIPTNFTTLTKGWHLMGTGSTINNLKELFNLEEVWSYENGKGWSKNPLTIEAGEGFWVKK